MGGGASLSPTLPEPLEMRRSTPTPVAAPAPARPAAPRTLRRFTVTLGSLAATVHLRRKSDQFAPNSPNGALAAPSLLGSVADVGVCTWPHPATQPMRAPTKENDHQQNREAGVSRGDQRTGADRFGVGSNRIRPGPELSGWQLSAGPDVHALASRSASASRWSGADVGLERPARLVLEFRGHRRRHDQHHVPVVWFAASGLATARSGRCAPGSAAAAAGDALLQSAWIADHHPADLR